MAQLQEYKSLDEKSKFFSNGQNGSFIINTIEELDRWFEEVQINENNVSSKDATALIYRGVKEAKHKLYTSAQRLWITEELDQWVKNSYLEFIGDLVRNANEIALINKIFDLYDYSRSDREFPILSLLQHYGAPTPLMDWSYNFNVAFYFGTDSIKKTSDRANDINQYFSVYRINKRNYNDELLNIIDFNEDEEYPAVSEFQETLKGKHKKNSNLIFYLSDFEEKGESKGKNKASKNLMIRTKKPYTLIYNQNIIPQEGMFIFNPYSDRPIEEIFNPNLDENGWNLKLKPFDCFNIHKDLGEYLRRKIDVKNKVNKGFIYPNLINDSQRIKEETLNGLI